MSSRSGQGKDENGVLLHYDAASNSLPGVDALHRRVHKGQLYTHTSTNLFVPALASFNLFIFPGTANAHVRVRVSCSNLGARRLIIYEDNKFSGEEPLDQTHHNYNRSVIVADPSAAAPQFTTTVTASGAGVIIYQENIPPLSDMRTQEFILKAATDGGFPYRIEAVNLDTVNAVVMTIHVDYYWE